MSNEKGEISFVGPVTRVQVMGVTLLALFG